MLSDTFCPIRESWRRAKPARLLCREMKREICFDFPKSLICHITSREKHFTLNRRRGGTERERESYDDDDDDDAKLID